MGLGGYTRRMDTLGSNRGSLVQYGIVTSVDPKTGTARVQLPDQDDMVTADLRVIQARTLKDQCQHLPDVGEHVACVFEGQGYEEGMILGAVYSEADPCPAHDPQVEYHKFEDGTEIEYDRKKHTLAAIVKGTADISATGNISATTEGNADISAKGAINISAQGEIKISSGSSITLGAPVVNINGTLNWGGQGGGAGTGTLRGNLRQEGNYEQEGNFNTSGQVGAQSMDAQSGHFGSINSNSHGH